MQITISEQDTLEDRDEFAEVLAEYLTDVTEGLRARTGAAVDVEELVMATLGNMPAYLPPRGALWIGRDAGGELVATICLKMIRSDAAEIKRLYIRPQARGEKLGQKLTELAIEKSKALGAARILIDTGRWMTPAIRLYEKLGFHEIQRYPESENDPALEEHLIYMEKVF